jgi:hypothetical protein
MPGCTCQVETDTNPAVVMGPEPPVPRSRAGLDLATTLERIQQNFVISDPSLPDCPIVFASESFLELTEYSREEILGRNCRFLQGPGTDPRAVAEIRDAINRCGSIPHPVIVSALLPLAPASAQLLPTLAAACWQRDARVCLVELAVMIEVVGRGTNAAAASVQCGW